MNSQTIVMCVVALILGMLLANMLKSVCGCKVVEGLDGDTNPICIDIAKRWHTRQISHDQFQKELADKKCFYGGK